jgi:hypothetical protein
MDEETENAAKIHKGGKATERYIAVRMFKRVIVRDQLL